MSPFIRGFADELLKIASPEKRKLRPRTWKSITDGGDIDVDLRKWKSRSKKWDQPSSSPGSRPRTAGGYSYDPDWSERYTG